MSNRYARRRQIGERGTCTPVSMRRPARARDWRARRDCREPPAATGQPSTWPSSAKISPSAVVNESRQRQDRVRRAAGDEGPRALAAELRAREERRGAGNPSSEARQQQRVPRDAERRERVAQQGVRVAQEGSNETAIAIAVDAQAFAGALEGAPQHHGGSAVERVGHERVA